MIHNDVPNSNRRSTKGQKMNMMILVLFNSNQFRNQLYKRKKHRHLWKKVCVLRQLGTTNFFYKQTFNFESFEWIPVRLRL